MPKLALKCSAIALAASICFPALAQDDAPDGPILFTNVDVFDGVSETLMGNVNDVVTGNLITEISTETSLESQYAMLENTP